MAWEYLQTDYLDIRFKVVAPFLNVDDKVIVDLDAGTCRLANFIPKTFKKYYANDIIAGYNPKRAEVDFKVISDEEMASIPFEQVDILCIFGHGAGHLNQHPLESQTATKSFIKMVKKYTPETLVIEGASAYNRRYGMLTELVEMCLDEGYIIKSKILVPGDGENRYSEREAYVLMYTNTV